jgi:hypothetical protein
MSERPRIRVTLPPRGTDRDDPDTADSPAISIQRGVATSRHSVWGALLWVVTGVGLIGSGAWLGSKTYSWPWGLAAGDVLVYASLLGLGGVACLIHCVVGRPFTRLLHQIREESARLRAAMTCPYCRDSLDESAFLCDRRGCGAVYHEECWQECRQTYGGCAIYGCGCTTGHEVGRFALQRRVARLVLAAVLFPPKAVARIRQLETQSFKEIWRDARRHQERVSGDVGRTMAYGLLNGAACVGMAIGLAVAKQARWISHETFAASLAPALLLPVLFIRLPLLRAFAWGSAKVVGRVFRDELAALGRADAGTVLARLVAGAGKKG